MESYTTRTTLLWIKDIQGVQPVGDNDYGKNKDSVPYSCCREFSRGCGENKRSLDNINTIKYIFVEGCLERLSQYMKEYVIYIIYMCAILGVEHLIVGLNSMVFGSLLY